MKPNRLLLIILVVLTTTLVRANENQPQGIDLGEYAFGIPTNQLNFTNQTPYTFSFWVNVKEYNHNEGGTQFINIRDPKFSSNNYPGCDWGYIHSTIGDAYDMFGNKLGEDMMSFYAYEGGESIRTIFTYTEEYKFSPGEWVHISFQYYLTYKPEMFVYVNGKPSLKFDPLSNSSVLIRRPEGAIIMIGGPAFKRTPLNAYVDKVQFYNRALTQSEVQASMYEPLLNDESLLGYWDFEDGYTTDAEGYMMADKGTIKATMYKILQQNDISIGTEIQPFTFAEGVNLESVLQGVEESTAEESNTKACVSNGVLYIENAEGINSVEIYDTTGKIITSGTYDNASVQISLPSTLKGVIMVKANNEVVKVMI